MRHVAFLLLCSLTSLAAADDPVVVPRPASPKWTELKADADGFAQLSAGDKVSEWELLDRAGATLIVPPDSTVAIFAASRPGSYRVVAVAEGKLVRCLVLVGDVPQPLPPAPPKPADELAKLLQAAYAADPSPTKAADLKQLVGLYVEAGGFAKNTQFATAADLFAAVSAAAGMLLPDADGVRRLAGVRKAIGAELSAVLPTDPDAPLTDVVRATAVAAFAKVARALEAVQP